MKARAERSVGRLRPRGGLERQLGVRPQGRLREGLQNLLRRGQDAGAGSGRSQRRRRRRLGPRRARRRGGGEGRDCPGRALRPGAGSQLGRAGRGRTGGRRLTAGRGRMLQTAGQCHDALQLRLVLLRVEPGAFLGLLAGGLGRSPGLELAGDGLQVVGHFRVGLEEEELQIAGLVLELHLRPILEDFRHGAVLAEEGQDLAPVRALDHVEAGHEGLLFLLRPGPAGGVDALPSCVCGRL